MKVTLIAATSLVDASALDSHWASTRDPEASDADFLAEGAGRCCYVSFHRPNPKTRENADYLRSIIEKQHFSVLEHASATFYLEGISRACTHELVRHRHLSFSQLSQRYVPAEEMEMVRHPALATLGKHERLSIEEHWWLSLRLYDVIVEELELRGNSGKKAREAARAVLPNMTGTKIVVTGNHRAWRDFLSKRLSPAADTEIQELAVELLRQLREIAPATYRDFDDLYEWETEVYPAIVQARESERELPS